MPQRFSISGALGVSLAAIVLTAIFLLVMVPPLIIAAFGPGTGASEPGDRLSRLVARHDDASKDAQERFNGRSAFFRPPPKFVPPPPTPVVKRDEPPPPPPGPPPPPANYTGPSLIAILGDQAWFKPPAANEKPLVLNVGAERSGVKLLSTNPPWSVKVAHKGGEYDVTLFAKTYERYFTANTPKVRPMIPGLLIQAPPAPAEGAATTSSPADSPNTGQDQASVDAAIEARRLRASRVDKSVEGDAAAQAEKESAGEAEETDPDADEKAGVEETHEEKDEGADDGEDPPAETETEPQPAPATPQPSADAAAQAHRSLTGEALPSENRAATAAVGRTSAARPK